MAKELPPLRRVVTGFDAEGESVFLEDGPTRVRTNPARPGMRRFNVWATGRVPVPIDEPDRGSELHGVMPLRGGSVLDIIDYPPEPKDPADRARMQAQMRERIRSMGVHPEPGIRRYPDNPEPGMHETDSFDYVIVLSGEIYAIVGKTEKLLKAGDVLIQRGTRHSWSNRSDDTCRVAFLVVDLSR